MFDFFGAIGSFIMAPQYYVISAVLLGTWRRGDTLTVDPQGHRVRAIHDVPATDTPPPEPGIVVVSPGDTLGDGLDLFRRRRITHVAHGDLPDHLVTLEGLYTACGVDFELSLEPAEPLGLRERRPPVRVVRDVRGDEGDHPTPHHHQHRVHREDHRDGRHPGDLVQGRTGGGGHPHPHAESRRFPPARSGRVAAAPPGVE